MAARTIAIGDVHGCAQALQALLKEVTPTEQDVIVTLGDYIDRGSGSREVLDQLVALPDQCQLVPLVGNHELMLLSVLEGALPKEFWMQCGGGATLISYGGNLEDIPQDHIDFIRTCRRFYETESHFFIHANYVADVPLAEQPENVALWEHVSYTMPPPHKSGKTAVVGHTPQFDGEILDRQHLICLDTFCVGGGWLTALDVEHGTVWQASQDGSLRDKSTE